MAKNYANNHEGAYLGELQSVQVGGFGRENKPCINFNFKLTHDAPKGEWDDAISGINIVITVRKWLSEGALPYTMKTLRKMGFNNNLEEPAVDGRFYEGNVELVCEHKQWKDAINEEWEIAEFKMGGATVQPLDTSALSVLKAQLNAAGGPPKGAPPPPPPAPKSPPPPSAKADDAKPAGKDDLPF